MVMPFTTIYAIYNEESELYWFCKTFAVADKAKAYLEREAPELEWKIQDHIVFGPDEIEDLKEDIDMFIKAADEGSDSTFVEGETIDLMNI